MTPPGEFSTPASLPPFLRPLSHCATHLIRNQANLRHVQELLGHRRLTTTERYLRLTITDLKAAHSQFHPREKETGNS
ncbi:MAG: tyrosine-type recombinase/integrase [Bacteroidota bacterium]